MYVPLKSINVTNVFPTESAPPGLNYYVATKELPYSHANDWDWFFHNVYDAASLMSGLRTSQAFGPDWGPVGYITAADQERLYCLGYNTIHQHQGMGPVVWGNQVVGSAWHLPEL